MPLRCSVFSLQCFYLFIFFFFTPGFDYKNCLVGAWDSGRFLNLVICLIAKLHMRYFAIVKLHMTEMHTNAEARVSKIICRFSYNQFPVYSTLIESANLCFQNILLSCNKYSVILFKGKVLGWMLLLFLRVPLKKR